MKLTVHYDPCKGEAFPDGLCETYIETIISLNEDKEMTVSSELFITALRVSVRENLISHEDVDILYKGERMGPDADGHFLKLAPDFCDTNGKLLLKLF